MMVYFLLLMVAAFVAMAWASREMPRKRVSRHGDDHTCRLFKALLAFFLVVTLDIPFARLRYHWELSRLSRIKATLPGLAAEETFVQLDKNNDHLLNETEISQLNVKTSELDTDEDGKVARTEFQKWASSIECEEKSDAYCVLFCDRVKEAAENRQTSLKNTRFYHPIAGLMSELFDAGRSLDQATKLTKLFNEKSCKRILRSIDRTNRLVDYIALTWAIGVGLALFGLGRSGSVNTGVAGIAGQKEAKNE